MKSTIIHEKKKITIGELIYQNMIYLIWFCILSINYVTNFYFNILVKNMIDSNICGINTFCDKTLELLTNKLCFSKKIICIGLLTNLFLMFTHKKNYSYLKIIFKDGSDKIILLIFTLLYCLSSYYKPLIYSISNIDENVYPKEHTLNLTIFFVSFGYYVFEIFLILPTIVFISILIATLIVLIISFFEYMFNIIYKFYESNIKDISFEYTESKFVDVEKNI